MCVYVCMHVYMCVFARRTIIHKIPIFGPLKVELKKMAIAISRDFMGTYYTDYSVLYGLIYPLHFRNTLAIS